MGRPMVEIKFYIPTKDRNQAEIDSQKVQDMIKKIWPKYKGATVLTGKGYYRPKRGPDEEATTYLVVVVTELTRAIKNIDGELVDYKSQIEQVMNQEVALISWQ